MSPTVSRDSQHCVVKEVDKRAECEEPDPEPEEDEDLLADGEEAQEAEGLHAATLPHLPPDTHAQSGHKKLLHIT